MQKYSAVTKVALLVSVASGSAAQGSSLDQPFLSANRNPLVQIHGLPDAQSAKLTRSGYWQGALSAESSNTFVAESREGEAIILDGETYRSTLNWKYGLAKGWELGLSLPVISQQAGGMDGFIEGWHDTFGLPDGDRVDYPKDQLRYAYQNGEQVLLDMQDNGEGLGDVSLSLAYQLAKNTRRSWAVRAGYKFATGNVDRLRGSDAADSYISLHLSDRSLKEAYGINFHLSGGLLNLGDGEVLAQQQEDQVWFGSTTLSWAYSESLSFKTQLDFHSAFYDSALKQIGDDSVQLLLGASVKVTDKLFFDFAISEDIAVETAPDVVFMFALRMGEWR
ncbi:DUF3187 family protein [Dasania sp. GY-MA-18]|uniref:DUF3187 family protein n=1 Tax=Dasania phycosphaerae TaxID=2950436 RepID=A0A9J6RKS8_9GAMM|nr:MULTISPECIES: DUF3187 family protein [Dasania]MCR8922509.1 DUF3187 family protein [Dasania sp. GY-MA-18]MCZ0864937.1 DUF3187 family protein [Dasania phycosphaerae]MCZ0868665.1 DUF3187 family protein [Dasania phycosphaerae]